MAAIDFEFILAAWLCHANQGTGPAKTNPPGPAFALPVR